MTALRLLGVLWPLGCLYCVARIAFPAVAQWRQERADVALARSRQIPNRLIDQWTSDDDEAFQNYLRWTP